MSEHCALCLEKKALIESHIYPEFIFDWMKKTGGRNFRNFENPDRLVQDGNKLHLLCAHCDNNLLGQPEGWFSNHCFYPLVKRHILPRTYDRRLLFVLISLAWRYQQLVTSAKPGYEAHEELFLRAQEEWRQYLLGTIPIPPTFHEVHLLIADHAMMERLPVSNHEHYMTRYTDGRVVSWKDRCLIYVKIPRFVIFLPLTPTEPHLFENTIIRPNGGEIQYPQRIHDGWFGSILIDSANRTKNALANRSMVQKLKDAEQLEKLPNSDWARAVNADKVALFHQFIRGRYRASRNSPCPCGSRIKFKRCHGRTQR